MKSGKKIANNISSKSSKNLLIIYREEKFVFFFPRALEFLMVHIMEWTVQ